MPTDLTYHSAGTTRGTGASSPPLAAKPRRIAEDLLAQLRAGTLKPGDQLPGIGRMRKQYGASQAVVEAVIRWFARRGLVTVSLRRGCFIADGPLPADVLATDALPGEAAPPPARRLNLDFYSRPRTDQRTLSIYLTEIFPRNLHVWNEELAVLRQRLGLERIQVLTCADGHVEDLWRQQRIDVALLNPQMVNAIGAESFLALDPAALGVAPAQYLPLVRQALEQGEQLRGAPFAVVLQHLFVNRDLTGADGGDDHRSIIDLLHAARAAQPGLRRQGRHAMRTVGRMHDLLIAAGALRCDKAGQFSFDEDLALPVLTALAGSGLEAVHNDDDVEEFAAGRMAYLLHCSYQAVDFADRVRFPLSIRPVPVAERALFPAELMLLAVNQETRLVGEALELIRHCSSLEVQNRFGRVGGNLPVNAAAAFDETTLASHPAGEAGLRRQLAHSTLLWPARCRRAAVTHFNPREDLALCAGTMSPEQVIARIRLSLRWLIVDGPA